MGGYAWTARDSFFLRTHYGRKPVSWIADQLGRTVAATDMRASELGLRRKARWREDEREVLRARIDDLTYPELAALLERSEKSVRHEAHRLGLRRRARRPVVWTAERVRLLEEHYGAMTAAELGAMLGVSEKAVFDKTHHLGLRKLGQLSAEAEAVLWELRDVDGVVEYFSAEFGVGAPAVRRALRQLRAQGGPTRPIGNVPRIVGALADTAAQAVRPEPGIIDEAHLESPSLEDHSP